MKTMAKAAFSKAGCGVRFVCYGKTENPCVPGSIPGPATTFSISKTRLLYVS